MASREEHWPALEEIEAADEMIAELRRTIAENKRQAVLIVKAIRAVCAEFGIDMSRPDVLARVAATLRRVGEEFAEDAEDAAEADAAMDEPGEDIPLEQLEAEFGHGDGDG